MVTIPPYRDTARCLVCGNKLTRARSSRLTCSDACRQARSRQLRAATPPLPLGIFDLLYADPPWHVRAWGKHALTGGRSLPYAHMDLPALCRLQIARLAAPNAVLAMWVNSAAPEATLTLIKAWGFAHPNEGLTWIKTSKRGQPRMGLGHSTRKSTESLWLAKRGDGLRRVDMGVDQSVLDDPIVAQRREHSRKPDETYVRLERLYGDVRRLELFGRRDRPGWARWGNELLPADAEQLLPFAPEELFEELR